MSCKTIIYRWLERNSAVPVCALSRPGDFGEAGDTLSKCLRKMIVLTELRPNFAPITMYTVPYYLDFTVKGTTGPEH